MKKPFFSIITCTLDSEKTISRNIKSVMEQSFQDFEHIFVDGYSKDKTLDFLKQYQGNYPEKIKIITRYPKGIANAFNEGIKESNGNYIIFLNSDDWFYDNKVLEDVYKFLENKEELDWIYGKVVFCDIKGNNLNIIKPIKLLQFKKTNSFAKYLLKILHYIPHQAVFMKKSVFENFGYFDEILTPILPDYEFFKRIRNRTNWCFVDRIIANFVFKGNKRPYNEIKKMQEVMKNVNKKYLNYFDYLILYCLKILFYLKNLGK
jgi:glycosyltransferase involved in cell wall biosynthesis